MSKQIEVFGALNISQKYLEKFFNKAGAIATITYKKDRVIIKFKNEEGALRSLDFDGKIIEQEQIKIRLCEFLFSKKSEKQEVEELFQHQDFTAQHPKIAQQLIWNTQMPLHRKVKLSILFRLMLSQIIFFQKQKQNSSPTTLVYFLEYQFLRSQSNVNLKRTIEGGQYILMTKNYKMILIDQARLISEKYANHLQFLKKLKKISSRLHHLYTNVFQRETMINTFQEPLALDQQFNVPAFSGLVCGSYSLILTFPYKQFMRPNILLLQQNQNKWGLYNCGAVFYFPTVCSVFHKSYFKFFRIISNRLQEVTCFNVQGLVFSFDVSLCEFIQKLEQIVRVSSIYKKVVFPQIQKQNTLLLVFDSAIDSISAVTPQIIEYLLKTNYNFYLIFYKQNQQTNKAIYNYFMRLCVQKSHEFLTTYKAQSLAQNLVEQGYEELLGKTNVFEIAKDLRDAQKQFPNNRKSKSNYSNSKSR